MTTVEFTTSDLIELGLPHDCDGGEVLSTTIVDERRWVNTYCVIFRLPEMPEGFAWKAYYDQGKTECQDERPWKNDDKVGCTLMNWKTVTLEKWMPVDGESVSEDIRGYLEKVQSGRVD